MKTRLAQIALTPWLVIIFAHPSQSQSSFYLDRGSFTLAAQAIPGNQQSINFIFLPPALEVPSITISDVTFTGRSLSRHLINSGMALFNFDSGFPLSIYFANGARAFGADFSS